VRAIAAASDRRRFGRWQRAHSRSTAPMTSRIESVRMAFVGLLSIVLALFLANRVLTVKLADVDFAAAVSFVPGAASPNALIALLLGVVAGVRERAHSVRLLSRAQEFVAT